MAHGEVFWAHDQTAGRGQGENAWHASPWVNLSVSIVVHPTHLPPAKLFFLNELAALSVAAVIQEFLPPGPSTGGRALVKWPNDVYVGNRKIAGILIQNGLRGQELSWSVIGIGLNVNEQDFPEELKTTAVSMRQLTGREHDRALVLDRLLAHFSSFYRLLDARLLPSLDRQYHELLYRKDEPARFLHVATGREFPGVIRGVNAGGQLVITMVGGRQSAFDLQEVRFV